MPIYQISQKAEGWLCLIMGVFFILFAIFGYWQNTVLLNKGIHLQGKIVSVSYTAQEKNPFSLSVRVLLPDSREQLYGFHTSEAHAVGDSFDVLYNPEDSRVSSLLIVNDQQSIEGILFILGLFLSLMGLSRIQKNQKLFGIF